MRRSEFLIEDTAVLINLLNNASYGTIGLIDNSIAYTVPLSFCFLDGAVCFHSANEGRKVTLLKTNKLASFSVVKPYSYIPSYFNQGISTQFFGSVYIEGCINIIDARYKKIEVLESLMKKYQAEGGYNPLESTEYESVVNTVLILEIQISTMTGKFKLGQNINQKQLKVVVESLKERNTETDRETLEMMQCLNII